MAWDYRHIMDYVSRKLDSNKVTSKFVVLRCFWKLTYFSSHFTSNIFNWRLLEIWMFQACIVKLLWLPISHFPCVCYPCLSLARCLSVAFIWMRVTSPLSSNLVWGETPPAKLKLILDPWNINTLGKKIE